jgi:hypothetical protein
MRSSEISVGGIFSSLNMIDSVGSYGVEVGSTFDCYTRIGAVSFGTETSLGVGTTMRFYEKNIMYFSSFVPQRLLMIWASIGTDSTNFVSIVRKIWQRHSHA